MSVLSIDNAAAEEVRRILERSRCRDPVAELIETRHSIDEENKSPAIKIIAHERADVPAEELCEVNGIAFVRGAAKALSDYCLTFDGERFLLSSQTLQESHASLNSALDARRKPARRRVRSAAEAISTARSA